MRLKGATAALVAAVLLLAGCSGPAAPQRVAATADQFTAAAQSLSFSTTDLTDQYGDEVYVASVIMATKEKSEIDFFVLVNDEFAAGVYDSNVANIQQLQVPGTTHGTESEANYQRYWVQMPNDYWVTIQVAETVLFAHVTMNEMDRLNSLLTKLGY